MKTLEKVYKSEEILESEDLYQIQEQVSSFGCSIKYQPTDGEIGWAQFINGKYAIADWFFDHLEENEEGVDILTFDDSFSEAFWADGHEFKAVMLSDDTALQKLFFWCYQEEEETE